jgi:hypothetical protein
VNVLSLRRALAIRQEASGQPGPEANDSTPD